MLGIWHLFLHIKVHLDNFKTAEVDFYFIMLVKA